MADANDIHRQFQQALGRYATADEIKYLGKFIDEGSLQPFEIGQIVQGLPEYQDRLLGQQTEQFGQRLAASDQDILGKAGAAINSQFANLGRPVSSGQAGALAQVGQNLAQQRQSALAQFYGQGLQQSRALSQSYAGNALERGYGLRDETRQRGYQLEDRNYMKDLYEGYLNRQAAASRRGALGGMIGTLGGGALGAAYGGPKGAYYGASAGNAFGQNLGGLF